jgi:hypothetical protein
MLTTRPALTACRDVAVFETIIAHFTGLDGDTVSITNLITQVAKIVCPPHNDEFHSIRWAVAMELFTKKLLWGNPQALPEDGYGMVNVPDASEGSKLRGLLTAWWNEHHLHLGH